MSGIDQSDFCFFSETDSINIDDEEELAENGVNIVIYANHLLRAAYPSMVKSALSILHHHRCKETSEELCMPIKEVINLIPGSK